MNAPNPPDYTDGLGELIRAHRLYLGLSQRTLADHLGMKEKSLSDIEVGRRGCPRGFIDTMERVADEFDAEVKATIEKAKTMLASASAHGSERVEVDGEPSREWNRAVIGRAAVESGLIMPILAAQYPAKEAARTART